MIILANGKAKEFIEELNKNVINDKFKKECKKASRLFKKNK